MNGIRITAYSFFVTDMGSSKLPDFLKLVCCGLTPAGN